MSYQHTRILELMAELASARHDDETSRDASLELITRAAKESIPDAHSVSISTRSDRGDLVTLAPTDDLSMSADKLQYVLNEGPCIDAAAGEPVTQSSDLGNDVRWRHYGPRSFSELGVVSQAALEMFSAGSSYGGLNLYSRSRAAFNDDEFLSMAELFACQAAVVMGHTATVKHFSAALESRKVIGQATGIVMARYGLDEGRAFQFLVRVSSTSNIKVRTVAAEIVAEANDTTTTQHRSSPGG